MTLTGSNAYTGLTTVTAGFLNIQNGSALGTTAAGTVVNSGAALQLQSGTGITVGAEALSLSGSGISNAGALDNVSGTNVWKGTVTLVGASRINSDAGSLTFNTAATSITGAGQNLTLGGSGTGSVGGIISIGTGSLTKDGSGIWTLSGVNTYTGATTVTSGTLKAGVATSSFGNNSAVSMANNATAVLDISAFSTTIGSLTGGGATGGNVNLGAMTLTVGGDNTSPAAYAGSIFGTGAVTKSGSGTLTFTGANTYSGLTTVSVGVLNIQNVAALGTTAAGTTVTAGAALQIQGGLTIGAEALTINGGGINNDGALRSMSGANVWQGTVTLGSAARINSDAGSLTFNTIANSITASNQNLTLGGAGNGTVAGTITIGSGTVTKDGNGTWTLTGVNTYTGITTVSAGVLNIQNATGLGTTAAGTTVTAGAALQIQGGITVGAEPLTLSGSGIGNAGALDSISGANIWQGTVTIAGAARINSDAGSLTFNTIANSITATNQNLTLGGASNGTVGGTITIGAGTLTKDGAGTWTLSGANTYTGATTVNGGTLKAGVASVANTSGAFGNNSAVIMGNFAGALLDITGFNTQIGSLTGGGVTGGNVTLGVATLTVGGDNSSPAAYAGVISDSVGGTITKIGTGVQIFAGANTYTGLTTVSAGGLNIQNATALGTTAAGTTVAAGAALQIQGGITVGAETLSLSGNGFLAGNGLTTDVSVKGRTTNATGALENISGINVWQGTVTLATAVRINSDAGSLTLSAANSITATNQSLILGGAGNGTVAGTITIGTGMLSKDGAGTWTLSGANTYTGLTSVNNGTLTLDFANASFATNIINSGNALAMGGGTLNMTGKASTTNSQTLGLVTLNAGASGFTINNNATANPEVLTLGNIFRKVGATVNFIQPANGAVGATNGYATGAGVASTILTSGGVAYGVVGGNDWAAKDATNAFIVGGSTLGGSFYTANTSSVLAGNADISAGVDTTLAAPATITSLRFNDSTTRTITATGQTLTTGGILVTPAVGNNLDTITGGTLNGPSGKDLVIIQNNTGNGLTINSTITDNTTATGLTKAGAGLLTLTGANTYTGPTTVSGTLQAGVASVANTSGAFGNNSAVTIADSATAVLDLNGFNTQIGSLSGGGAAGGSVTMGSATLTTGGDNTNAFYAGILTGSSGNSLIKNGTGLFSLSGSNTLTGGITLNSGILQAGANAYALGGSGSVLTLNGGLLQITDTVGLAFNNNVTVSGNTIVWLDRGGTQGPGINSTFGTLNIGPQTLYVYGGSAVTSGVAGLTFGAVTLTGGTTSFDVFNRTGPPTSQAITNLTVGSIGGTGNIVKAGNGNLVINGSIGSGAGSLTVYDFNAAAPGATPTNAVYINGSDASTGTMTAFGGVIVFTNTSTLASTNIQLLGGCLQFGTANSGMNLSHFTNTTSLTLGGGSVFLYQLGSLTVSDTMGTLTLQPGSSSFGIASGASGTYRLSLDSLASRAVGSTLSFPNSTNFPVQFRTSAPALTGGIIGGWAVNGASWATVSGAGVDVSSATFDGTNINSPTGNRNMDQTLAGVTTLATSSTINSLRLTGAAVASSPALNLGGNTLTLTTGGLMNNNSSSQVAFITSGTLTAGSTANSELFIMNANSTGQFGIGATIADNPGGSVNLVRAGSQSGDTYLSGVNTYTGKTFIENNNTASTLASPMNGGALGTCNLNILTERQLGAFPTTFTADKLYINNGTIRFTDQIPITLSTLSGITLGGLGGTINFGWTSSFYAVLNTPITGTGPLAFCAPQNSINIIVTGSNTYDGPTLFCCNNGNYAFTTIANIGQPSSFGQPSNAANGLLRMGANGCSLIFVGIGDQSTNRDITGEGNGAMSLAASGAGSLTLNGNYYFNDGTSSPFTPLLLVGGGFGILNGNIIQQDLSSSATYGVKKDKTGTWLLTGQNTYNGPTQVTGGTLEFTTIGNVGSGPSSLGAPATVANGTIAISAGVLRFVGSTNQTSDRIMSFGGSATIDASGSNGAALTLMGTVTNSVAATVTFAGTGGGVVSGPIINGVGTTAVTKAGPGAWTFNPPTVETYTGATTVNGGTLTLDYTNLATPTNLINNASALTLGGGNLSLLAKGSLLTSQTFGAVTLTANTGSQITLNSNGGSGITMGTGAWTRNGGSTLNINTIGTTTLAGNPGLTAGLLPYATISGTDFATVTGGNLAVYSGYTGSLVQTAGANANSYTLSGSQTQTGTVALTALKITGTANGQSLALGTFNLGSGNANMVGILYDGGASNYGYTISGSGSSVIGTAAQELIVHDTRGTLTIATALGNTTGAFTKAGTGTVILSATNNTYTGQTNVNAGTLQAGAVNAFSPTSIVNVNVGATLALNGFNNTIGGLIGAGTVINGGAGDASLTVGNETNNTVNSFGAGFVLPLQPYGILADGAGGGKLNLVKIDSNPIVFTANNTFTGGVTIKEGYICVPWLTDAGVSGPLGSGSSIILGSTGRQGVLSYYGGNGSTNRAITLADNGVGTLDVYGNASATTGMPGLSAAQTLFGNTALFSGNITGNGQLAKTGLGNVMLSGSNSYTGATNVRAGTLQFNNVNAIGGSGASITVGLTGIVATGYALDQAFLSRINPASAGAVALGADSSNNLNMSGLPGMSLGAVQNYSFTGTLTPANNTYKLGGGMGTLFIQNANTLTGGASLVVSPNNTFQASVVIADAQNYSGPTTVQGTLNPSWTLYQGVSDSVSLLTIAGGAAGIASTSAITVGSQGTLRIVASAGDSISNKLGSAPITLNGGNLQYYNDGSSANFAQNIGAVTFGLGQNIISTGAAQTGATSILTLSSSLNRLGYSTVDFGGSNTPSTTTAQIIVGNASTPLGVWATTGNFSGFATYSGNNIVKATETAYVSSFSSNATNYTIAGAANIAAASGSANTIRVTGGSAATTTINVGTGNILAVNAIMGMNGSNTPLVIGSGTGVGTVTPATGTDIYFYTSVGGSPVTINSNISAPGGTIVRGGGNTSSNTASVALNGTNTFSQLVINIGNLSVSGTASLPSTANVIMNGGSIDLQGGATYGSSFIINADSQIYSSQTANPTVTGNVTLNNNAWMIISGQNNKTFTGSITGAGGVFITGANAGIATFSGTTSNTYTGQTWFYGDLSPGNQDTIVTLQKTNAIAIPGDIYLGWQGDKNTGGGSTHLDNQERLVLGAAGSGGNQIADNAVIYFAGGAGLDAGDFELKGMSETIAGIQSIMTGDGLIENQASTSSTLTLSASNGKTYAFSGLIRDGASGKLAIVISGSSGSMQVFSGSETYTGFTALSGGVLSTNLLANGGVASSIGASTNVAANLVFDGGTLQYTGPTTVTDRNYTLTTNGGALDASGSGPLTVGGSMTASGSTGNQTFTLTGANTAANTMSGAISNGTGSNVTALTKSGAGTWVLSGTSTYTGATTVSGGTLVVGGSLTATASASVAALSTLQVDGLVNTSATTFVSGSLKGVGKVGNVQVLDGGTLAPGHNNPGILTVANGVTFNSGAASLSIVINNSTAGTGYGQLKVTGGGVTLNGATLNLTLNYTPILAVVSADGSTFTSLGDTFYLVLGNSTIGGQFANTQAANFSGNFSTITIGSQEYAINYQSDGGLFNDGLIGNQIALMAIPEPQTWVMFISGLGMLTLLRRRK